MATAEEDQFEEVHSHLRLSTTSRRPHCRYIWRMVRTAPTMSVNEQWELPRKALNEDLPLETPGHWFHIMTIQPSKCPCFVKHQKCFSSVAVQQARQQHSGLLQQGEDSNTRVKSPLRKQQLLFLTLLTLERERTPEGQRGGRTWCLLDHPVLHRSTGTECNAVRLDKSQQPWRETHRTGHFVAF